MLTFTVSFVLSVSVPHGFMLAHAFSLAPSYGLTLAWWCHVSTWLFTVCGDVKIPARSYLSNGCPPLFFFILIVSSVSVIAPDTTRDSGLP
jgi:hypothetical protein